MRGKLYFLIIIAMLFTLVGCMGCDLDNEDELLLDTYTLTDGFLQEEGTTYIYTGKLTNTASSSYEYTVTVYLFNENGVGVKKVSVNYVLAPKGFVDVIISTNSNDNPINYEVKVLPEKTK